MPLRICRVAPRVPGLRSLDARSPGTRACEVAARAASRWPWSAIHDVKQRSVVRSRGALLRPGLSSLRSCLRFRVRRRAHGGFGAGGRRDISNSIPPMRGGWSADRRTLFFGRACEARPAASRGDRDPSRRSTVAVFGCGPTKPAPGSGTGAAQRLPAPSRNGLTVGVRTSLRCGSRRGLRDATPCSVLQDRF